MVRQTENKRNSHVVIRYVAKTNEKALQIGRNAGKRKKSDA